MLGITSGPRMQKFIKVAGLQQEQLKKTARRLPYLGKQGIQEGATWVAAYQLSKGEPTTTLFSKLLIDNVIRILRESVVLKQKPYRIKRETAFDSISAIRSAFDLIFKRK